MSAEIANIDDELQDSEELYERLAMEIPSEFAALLPRAR